MIADTLRELEAALSAPAGEATPEEAPGCRCQQWGKSGVPWPSGKCMVCGDKVRLTGGSAPAGEATPQLANEARIVKLARQAATRDHCRWKPGTKRFKESGHDGVSQIDCAHPDCALVRAATGASAPPPAPSCKLDGTTMVQHWHCPTCTVRVQREVLAEVLEELKAEDTP